MDEQVCLNFRFIPDLSVMMASVGRNTSMDEIRAIWCQERNMNESELSFILDSNKKSLPQEGTVNDILPPDGFYLGILVNTTIEVQLTLCGLPSTFWTEQVLPDTTVDALVTRAREQWKIDDDRCARLLDKDGVVDPKSKFQDLDTCQEFQVDFELTFRVATLRPAEYHPAIWIFISKTEQEAYLENELPPAFPRNESDQLLTTKCFMSSPASVLMGEERHIEEQRIISTDFMRTADAKMFLGSVLNTDEVEDGTTNVLLELSIDLKIKRKQEEIEVCLWPTDQLNRLRKKCGETLFINGEEEKNLDSTFFQLGIPHGSCAVISDTMSLRIRDTKGETHSLKVDRDTVFDDLLFLIQEIDSGDYMVTIDDTTILHSSKTLRQLGVQPNSNVFLHVEERSIRLVHEWTPVNITLGTNSNFEGLLQKASTAIGTSLPEDTKFTCSCGRVIENKSHRCDIPKRCCLKRVLTLWVNVPIPQTIEMSNNFSELCCRLPADLMSHASSIFNEIKWWGLARSRPHRRLMEERLLRAVLCFLEAKDIKVRPSGKFLFTIEVPQERKLQCFSAPDKKLRDVARMIERKTKKTVVGFTTRKGTQKLWLNSSEGTTLFDAPVRKGQTIIAELLPRPDHATQTDCRTTVAADQTGTNYQEASSIHPPLDHATQTDCRTTVAADQKPPQDLPIKVSLPNHRQTDHFVPPQQTVGAFLAAMERLCPNLRFGDLCWNDRFLTSVAEWERQRLREDWKVTAGSCLHLHARPHQLSLTTWDPQRNVESVNFDVIAEKNAAEVLETARRKFREVPIGDAAVVFGHEVLHGAAGALKRAVLCIDRRKGEAPYIDNENGQTVQVSEWAFYICRFLRPSSPPPASARLFPVILIIHTDTECVQMGEERQLQPAPAEALYDPAFVALLEGVRCGNGEQFWILRGGHNFVNAATGAVLEGEDALPGGRNKRRYCLLKPGDHVPYIAVSEDEQLRVFYRAGVVVQLGGGRLMCEEPLQPQDLERWESSIKGSDFEIGFSEAARRKHRTG